MWLPRSMVDSYLLCRQLSASVTTSTIKRAGLQCRQVLHQPRSGAFQQNRRQSTLQSTLAFYKRQFLVTPKPADPNVTILSGQTGIVTGANVGLGFEVSKQLLRLRLGHLILAVRSAEKGEAAKKLLSEHYPGSEISVWNLDLNSYESIQEFAARCSTLPRLDVAILNAGVIPFTFHLNPQTKHEETIQVNSISTPLLAALLLPALAERRQGRSAPGKLTIVGSETAEWTSFKEQKNDPVFSSFDSETTFKQPERYYVSKLLPEFWVIEAAKRIDPRKVVLNIVNPGFCYGSALHRDVPGLASTIFETYKRAIGRTMEVGARPIVDAAVVQGSESHGKYCSDCAIDQMAPLAMDETLRKRIWAEYEKEFGDFDLDSVWARVAR